jgi:hypothetical protein
MRSAYRKQSSLLKPTGVIGSTVLQVKRDESGMRKQVQAKTLSPYSLLHGSAATNLNCDFFKASSNLLSKSWKKTRAYYFINWKEKGFLGLAVRLSALG